MKKKTCTLINLSLMMGIFLMLASGCSKSDNTDNPTPSGSTVTDIDGNVYHTVTIGTQVWMVENLKTTKYRNGDPIPNVTSDAAWCALSTGAYCWYDNDAATYKAKYGALYNWFAVADNRNIAPVGWHVPTDTEWTTLTTFLGGENLAGGKLKETGTSHWRSPNTGATNSSGFTALPAGSHYTNGYDFYGGLGSGCGWWTSSQTTGQYSVWDCSIGYDSNGISRYYDDKRLGQSVRLIMN